MSSLRTTFLTVSLCKNCTPSLSKPPLSHQAPSKNYGLVNPPFLFENLVRGLPPPRQKEEGGVHTMGLGVETNRCFILYCHSWAQVNGIYSSLANTIIIYFFDKFDIHSILDISANTLLLNATIFYRIL